MLAQPPVGPLCLIAYHLLLIALPAQVISDR
jgi:hypothetical protein